jgi:hemolysin activation/secretion protein
MDFNLQNFGAKDTGRFGGQVRAQFYGLTGAGDRTTVALYTTTDYKEQQILQLGHDFRVGAEGLTFGGHFTYAWTRPDIGETGKVNAHTLFANIEGSYPFIRSQTTNLSGSVGLDYVDQTVRFRGTGGGRSTELSRDRLRIAYLRLDVDATDPRERLVPAWRLAYSIELRQGLNVGDPSEGTPRGGGVGPSRLDGDAEGTLVRFQGSGDLAIAPNITFSLMPRAQYSFDPLLSFEEFSGGTYTVGRGYDPGTITGDSGVGASAELRINRIQPLANTDLTIQPFVFVDSAWTWDKHVASDPRRLTSVGGGMRTSFDNRFRLDLTVAVPTVKAGLQAERGDTRILLSFTTRLWPEATR